MMKADNDAAAAAAVSILHFLLIQTYLDGGSCYATSYRDSYDNSNILPDLLRAAKYGKLLQFMESKHSKQYMSISDRSKPPHIVSLTDDGREMAVKLTQEFFGNNGGEYNRQLQSAEGALKERLVYRLRQNYCKLRRRKANRQAEGGDAIDEVNDPSGVSLPWLVKKCPKECHMYARLQPNRPMDVLPFSKEWNVQVEPILLDFVQEHADTAFVIGQRNGVANVGLIQSLQGEEEEGGCGSIDLEAIRIKLVSILGERGNAVGGLDVGNILTDPKMRRLLGGRDLSTVIHDNLVAFESFVEIYQDDQRNNAWYCKLSADGFANSNKGTSGVKRKKDLLYADEVGTYSLTDTTSALAMTKVLAGAFDTGEGSKVARSTVAIDMTAGVGGNTIGLCKLFPKVIAYEIDADRIEFLKRNISERVDASTVDVTLRCGDSVQALDSLQAELRGGGFDISKQVAVIIDPPFGGTHYRRRGGKMIPPNGEVGSNCYGDEGLRLGDVPLSEVVEVVMGKLKPCAVGLKLPLNFDVHRFAKRLVGGSKNNSGGTCSDRNTTTTEAEEMELQIKAIRRLARNLFVVVQNK
mmetsp:Transcript_3286/g.9450  ORF Transcript_3286/g.9450 Transcript_3286/m.9450 type:complete len:580 (+) Transcript_3286:22-1761(+)